jgi:hypothetical protein
LFLTTRKPTPHPHEGKVRLRLMATARQTMF